eukprot:TRINITY_DN12386_c0_g1_i4.p1 TRINITY_DN12386_c0_g1~~TRINITY_DN12386_c0_g1_i4.p1  ORF type:complete len:318 (-),score=87.99 TRINITY_DN12386_c0_g1_i4:346-1299(-)
MVGDGLQLGYGSSSESEEGNKQYQEARETVESSEEENNEQQGLENSYRKRSFVPKAQQYMHLLEEELEEYKEDLENHNKRRRIGTGSTILDNLPPPENLISSCTPTNLNFNMEEFKALESRNDPGLELIDFQVQAAANESDVEEQQDAVSVHNLLENELIGVQYNDDDQEGSGFEEGEEDQGVQNLGQNKKTQQFNGQNGEGGQERGEEFEGLPKEVQQHLSKLGGSVQFSEIKAEDIRDLGPGQGANEHDPIVALGKEYALGQRALAGEAPSRQARRKHQIGSLLHDARMNEMEFLLRESQGKKSKAETEAKYGWR